MSLGSLLGVARNAIMAHHAAAQVVSQNIANVGTEGYSRQRADLTEGLVTRFPYGSVGSGVFISGISRIREEALDVNYRRQSGNLESATTRQSVLAEVQGIFGEPQDQGLATSLDAFWSSWSDLANAPGNSGAQAVVRQRGANVASMLNQYATRLGDVASSTASGLATTVDQVNALASRMASLNLEVTTAEAAGQQAPDLRDERDRVADELSKLTGSTAIPQKNGTYTIVIGGATLVDATNARPMALQKSGSSYSITIGSSPDSLQSLGGRAGAMLGIVNVDIPAIGAKLDSLAAGIVSGVNYLHEQGWTASGEALQTARGVTMNWNPANGITGPGIDFFDPSRTTAASISLSADVAADPSVVASGITQNGPGDNSLALRIASLRDGSGMSALSGALGGNPITGSAAGTSYADFYRGVVTQLGVDVSTTDADVSSYQTLEAQAGTRREQVFGVSLDEELADLMKHQQAFSAASHVVKVVDEMMQTVLGMV
jgi:flagellar hook-associated protein 1 FlgK